MLRPSTASPSQSTLELQFAESPEGSDVDLFATADDCSTVEDANEAESNQNEQSSEDEEEAAARYKQDLCSVTDKRLFDPEQDAAEGVAIRAQYSTLCSRLRENKRLLAAGELCDFIAESSSLYKKVRRTAEATLDSSLLVLSAEIGSERVQTLFKTASLVTLGDFLQRLKGFLALNAEPQTADCCSRQMACLGRRAVACSLRVGASVDALSAALQCEFPADCRSQPRAKSRSGSRSALLDEAEAEPDDLSTPAAAASKATAEEAAARDNGIFDTPTLVVATYKKLRDVGPVNFFRFFINPASFGQSVENLFYCSFLVREEKAAIYCDKETQTPVIGNFFAFKFLIFFSAFLEALDDDDDDQEEAAKKPITSKTKNQIALSFTHEIWARAIEKYAISHATIPHRL